LEILRRALHVGTIVRADREDTDVIRILVEREVVYRCESIKIGFCFSLQFNLGHDFHFIARPAFDRDCASWCADYVTVPP
jgi:hypothetical protein